MIDRIYSIFVGISQYHEMTKLDGTVNDVQRLKKILVDEKDTAIIIDKNCQIKVNIDSSALRKIICDFSLGRTSINDILLFYFSGHATILSNNDLGLCLVDTRINQISNSVVPISTVRISELIDTLAISKIDPIFVLDCCFSGTAGETFLQSYSDARKSFDRTFGSTYALFCSAMNWETSVDFFGGGPFSEGIFKVINQGNNTDTGKRKQYLTLTDIFSGSRKELERTSGQKCQLFLGEGFPEVPIAKNKHYQKRKEKLSTAQQKVLNILFNDGSPKILTISQLQALGSSEHTTYSKLGYAPAWNLIKKEGRQVKLSDRGLELMQGKIAIPKSIYLNSETGEWIPEENTDTFQVENKQIFF